MMNLAERVSRIERLMYDLTWALSHLGHIQADEKIKNVSAELFEAVNAAEFQGYATEVRHLPKMIARR